VASRKDDARRWFDRRARAYEGGWTARWRDPVQRESLAALELTSEDRLLDLSCGTGAASREAAPLVTSVAGVDLSSEMIREATDRSTGIGNLTFEVADAEALPFADGSFTAVLCSNAFHHYPEPARAVAEMARVLATSGRLVIGDACSDSRSARIADAFLRRFEPGHVRLYRSRELGGFILTAGLSGVRLRTMTNGGHAIVRAIR
jgi:ubiquinone/menaquinone biosynthesis C-methylase UbiE